MSSLRRNNLNVIPQVIGESDKAILTAPFRKMEIDEVIKRVPPDKAPGPDELLMEFYLKCWDVMASDTQAAVDHFFRKLKLPNSWKALSESC